ncbi:cytochrome c biogenesis protein [Urbifossiella limnaea]|uniref:Cytochrome c biogenesis protein CcsA n=1 Tax=Urbifossiella limnaea TaxID=2528023 RepID=A0A517XXI2_9BACT|nr:cytochrome c biogenesis protein CcsA [Urbifossiella limnaea]QDU22171.1 Cytochrome c biogenesis protein CcsA [Urbifossiella limnaea]
MTPTDPAPARAPRPSGWYLPYVCLAVVGMYLASAAGRMNPPRQPFDLEAFARIPVVEGGRVKPLDSAIRLYMRSISGREEYIDLKGDRQPAIKWYLEVLASSREEKSSVYKYKVFRIDNEQVLTELKLAPNADLRYSVEEIGKSINVVLKTASVTAQKRQAGQKVSLYETKMSELASRLQLFMNLARFRGLDQQSNALLLLPPQTDDTKWTSLGDYRDNALRDALLAAMNKLRELLPDARINALTADEAIQLIGPVEGIDPARLSAEQKAEFLTSVQERLKISPALIPDEERREWVETALPLLPQADQSAVRSYLRSEGEARLVADPVAAAWQGMVTAYRENKPDEFNRIVAEYHAKYLDHVSPRDKAAVRVETGYNRFAPFYYCTVLYGMVFLLAAAGLIASASEKPAWGAALQKSAGWVLYATVLVHTAALIVRMYVMDRPFVFVTNLYSSAVFIGWGCVVLGLVLERIFRIGIGNAVAGVLGLATTIVAHNLATDDTLEMMQAVLDTNFWLATHVTTVTLGYTATFFAGFLGAVYVLLQCATVVKDGFTSPQPPSLGGLLSFGAAAAGIVGVPMILLWFFCTAAAAKFEWFHPNIPLVILVVAGGAAAFYAGGLLFLKAGDTAVDANGKPLATGQLPAAAKPLAGMALDAEKGKVLGQMIYGVVCFATLLSFVGTVLGGIWADQSWGRFWGWDPKENGAVLIVLWNALILHARWCGMVKTRGVAVLALFGNVICAWSWFGTNQLGIGLHAYGFDTRLADGCTNFWLSQLLIMGLGLIPARFWASATRRRTEVPVVAVAATTAPAAGPTVVKKKAKKR